MSGKKSPKMKVAETEKQLRDAEQREQQARDALTEAETKVEALLDRADPGAGRDLSEARAAVELATRQVDQAEAATSEAATAHRAARRDALAASLPADDNLNGMRERAAVETFTTAFTSALADLATELGAVSDAHAEAARLAEEVGLPRANTSLGTKLPYPVPVAYVPGKHVIMPGRTAEVARPHEVAERALDGEDMAVPVATATDTKDDLPKAQADEARGLLAAMLSVETVQPLGDWQPFADGRQVAARIDAYEVDVNGVATIGAVVYLKGGVKLPPNSPRSGGTPGPVNGVILHRFASKGHPSGGKRVEVVLQDPATAQRDPNEAGQAVANALASADTTDWPEIVRKALANDAVLVPQGVHEQDDGTVTMFLHQNRYGRDAGRVATGSAIRDSLLGVPVLGYGVVCAVEPYQSVGIRLVFGDQVKAAA